jgi:hypothetical protein
MASRNKDERAHVNALVKAIQKNSPGVYVFIDRDAGNMRHTSSGWDFLLVQNGRAVFCEAKQSKGRLSSWQKFVQAQITASKTKYCVIRFSDDGKNFQIDNREMIDISTAKLEYFL